MAGGKNKSAKQGCPRKQGTIWIGVKRSGPLPPKPISGASVTLTGPTPGSGVTDQTGYAKFPARKPGQYKFTVALQGKPHFTLEEYGPNVAVAAGEVAIGRATAYATGTLIVRVLDDLGRRVEANTLVNAAVLSGAHAESHKAADLYKKVPAGKVRVSASAIRADLFASAANDTEVEVTEGGTERAVIVLPAINTVMPQLETAKGEVWAPPQTQAAKGQGEGANAPAPQAAPQQQKESPVAIRLGYVETCPEKPYKGSGTLTFDATKIDLFAAQACTGAPMPSGKSWPAAELKKGVTVYAKGKAPGTTDLTLALAASGNATIVVRSSVSKPLKVRTVNLVKPKIELEYKIVLLERKLSAHQDGEEEKDKIFADPTRIEVSLEQTNAPEHPFKKGGTLKCAPANVEIFLDEKCTKKSDGKLTNAQLVQGEALKLWLRGKTAGKFDVSLELEDPADPFVKISTEPHKQEVSVVELKSKLHQFDEAAIANEEFEAEKDTLDAYFVALKDKELPKQKAMTDEEKVKTGRMLHAQKDGSHGRARLLLEKLVGDWPAEADEYSVVIDETKKSGGLQVYDKEVEGELKALPHKVKVKDLKAKEVELWVEGKGATKKWRDVVLDIGVDRGEGGLEKAAKRNGDWARFTVVQIKEVKLDYKPEAGKAAAWDEAKGRFYINVKADPEGRKIKLAVELTEKLKDIPVHFLLAPHKDNGKAANWGEDLPATWKWKDIAAAVKHKDRSAEKKLLHLSKKTDADGKAELEVTLSRFGGDVFEPGAYITQDPHLAKYVKEHADLGKRKPVRASRTITVWRKIWVKRIDVAGLTKREFGGAIGQYERVKVEMISLPPLELAQATVNGFTPRAVYPRYMIEVNGGNADALVVSDPNKGNFFTTFSIDGDKPNTIPILVCDAQWDPKGTTGSKSANDLASNFPLAITYPDHADYEVGVLSPPLQGGDLFVSGSWEAKDAGPPPQGGGPAPWVNPRNGNLTKDDVSISPGRGGLAEVSVRVPPGVGATNATTRVWIKSLKVRRAGIYLGESFQKRILAVYDPKNTDDFQNTIAHELGHAYHQVVEGDPAGGVAGVPKHPNQKDKGQGNHCRYLVNKCVMYDSGPIAGSLNRYCKVCHPYLLVQDMTTIV